MRCISQAGVRCRLTINHEMQFRKYVTLAYLYFSDVQKPSYDLSGNSPLWEPVTSDELKMVI